MTKWLAFGLTLLLTASTASAQNAVTQNGTVVPGDLAQWARDRVIQDAGGLFGRTGSGQGLNPFSITDNHGDGLCINDAATTGPYHKFCFGHDASGNATITVEAVNGAAPRDCILTVNGVSSTCLPGTGTANGLPFAPDNASLKATPITFSPYIIRTDFTAGRGAPAVLYHASNVACPLNAGAGDDGSQVKSSDNKCWIANFTGMKPNPMDWGAIGDGSADDTVPVQAAITAMLKSTLYTGSHLYCIKAVNVGNPADATASIDIIGDGPLSGFNACAINQTLLKIFGNYSQLKNFAINANHAGANTSGYGVGNNTTYQGVLFEDLVITGGCPGIELNGNSIQINRTLISGAVASTCDGVRFGLNTTLGVTVAAKLTNSAVNLTGGTGLRYLDCGGCYMTNVDVVHSAVGTVIFPGANQEVSWSFFSNSSLGDTSTGNGLIVDTAASTGAIKRLGFFGTWTSGNAGNGVAVHNTAGGFISGMNFSNHRSMSNGLAGFDIGSGVPGLKISESSICGNSTATANQSYGIAMEAISQAVIQDNVISNTCGNIPAASGTQRGGIYGAGTNQDMVITNNMLCGNGIDGEINLQTPTGNSIINNNQCVDGQATTLATGSTITLSNTFRPTVFLTGTTTVLNIASPGWVGRTVKFIPQNGPVTFATGGAGGTNICVSKTVAQGAVGEALFVPGSLCWAFNN